MVFVMRLTRLWLLSLVGVALLAGCARVVVFGHVVNEGTAPEVAQNEAPASAPAAATGQIAAAVPATVLKSVTLKVAPLATDDVASDTPFVPELLLEAIRTELRSRKLLDENNPQATGTAEVQIATASVKPSSNAVVFGYKMMAGTLIGDIQLSGTSLHVLAETKLTISVKGGKKDPLDPLYRRFAELTADRLAGIESKPDPSSSNQRF